MSTELEIDGKKLSEMPAERLVVLVEHFLEQAQAEHAGNMFNVYRCECVRAINRLMTICVDELASAEDVSACAVAIQVLVADYDARPKNEIYAKAKSA